MFSQRGNSYQLYLKFQRLISIDARPQEALTPLRDLIVALGGEAAAAISAAPRREITAHAPHASVGPKILQPLIGDQSFFADYVETFRHERDALAEVLRISPHPVAVSDLARHRRLGQRIASLAGLLQRHGFADVLALPVFDGRPQRSMILIAGPAVALGPMRRHLIAQAITDLLARGGTFQGDGDSGAGVREVVLTARQYEIAGWLVRGKTDWEIGEILDISAKTVNFHVENIKRAYGVKSRNQAVARLVREGRLNPLQ